MSYESMSLRGKVDDRATGLWTRLLCLKERKNRVSVRLCLISVLTTGLLIGSAASPGNAHDLASDFSAGNSWKKSPALSSKTDYMQLAERRGGGSARSRGARVGSHDVNRNKNVNRNTNINRNTDVNRNTNINRNKNTNINVNRNRNVNVHVDVRTRPYGWRGARWGAVAFGVTMGAIIVVAANTPPPPPDPSLCWTWTNSALTEGYWYYCSGP